MDNNKDTNFPIQNESEAVVSQLEDQSKYVNVLQGQIVNYKDKQITDLQDNIGQLHRQLEERLLKIENIKNSFRNMEKEQQEQKDYYEHVIGHKNKVITFLYILMILIIIIGAILVFRYQDLVNFFTPVV